MALVGNLKDLKLANIIQINCIERNVAKVTVRNADKSGALYFSGGAIVHAEFGAYIGERAVHEMLALNEGDFKVEAGIEAPAHTISQPWNSVVLEGLRLIDEKEIHHSPVPKQLFAALSDLSHVRNVFVMDYKSKIVEGRTGLNMHPFMLSLVWYKFKKILNLFYSDLFQYIVLGNSSSYIFIFEHRPNLIVIETDLRVVTPEFAAKVKNILKKLNFK